MIKVDDCPNPREKLRAFGLVDPKTLAILPTNLNSAKNRKDLFYAETTPTVRVLFKQAGIVETPIEKDKEIPEFILESFDWVSPIIFFTSALISQNPDIVDTTISKIIDYLQEWFKGIPNQQRNVRLHIVTETKGGAHKAVDYEGDVAGLRELPKVIRSLHDEH
jgi:hypothetical protein